MAKRANKYRIGCVGGLILLLVGVSSLDAKKKHPYDLYDHEMHMGFFEGDFGITCDTCHADPDSYVDRKKVNRMGCHQCHNNPKAALPANNTCTLCHVDGPPKPASHQVDWVRKHQAYAKTNEKECLTCHTNKRFCLDCHQKRDTVDKKMHSRNFRLTHSITARANPRKCDACHTINYCQECHSGRGSSKR